MRFRTIGDATCTAAVESTAAVDDMMAETSVARVTERGAARADDRISEAGIEDRSVRDTFDLAFPGHAAVCGLFE